MNRSAAPRSGASMSRSRIAAGAFHERSMERSTLRIRASVGAPSNPSEHGGRLAEIRSDVAFAKSFDDICQEPTRFCHTLVVAARHPVAEQARRRTEFQ